MQSLIPQPYEDSNKLLEEKLEHFDYIEGYKENDPEESLYQKAIITAYIIDEDGNETGETVRAYIYHRKGIDESDPVPNGDWL